MNTCIKNKNKSNAKFHDQKIVNYLDKYLLYIEIFYMNNVKM